MTSFFPSSRNEQTNKQKKQMTITNKNKHMLLGAIGLIHHLHRNQKISYDVYYEFMQIIHVDEQAQQTFITLFVQQFQHQPLKRGRKKLEIKFINELPILCSDQEIDDQDDLLNLAKIPMWTGE